MSSAQVETTPASGPASAHELDAIFRPRGVAVVGASQDPTKRGYQAVRALIDAGFSGRIQPVNPKGGDLLGLRVYRSIAELDPVPDVALVCTPAATAASVIRDCGQRGIRGAVVLALGFAETGPAGERLQSELAAVARETGVRVVGPNTSGILNSHIGLNLIGARGARAGSIALLVQSGNMALSLLNQAAAGHEGISICIGAGNQVDLTFADYLRYLECDASTRVIAMYVEDLGDGRGFLDAAREARKPMVLLKGGRSVAGQAAARSHTGALAGEYAVLRAALRQSGVIEVTRADELFPVAETLALQPPTSRGIAVLSDGGGHATLAADALSELGAPLVTLCPDTITRLRAVLGPNASVGGVTDMANAPDAAPRVFGEAMRILMSDESVGGVLVVGLFGGYAIRFAEGLAGEEETAAEVLASAAAAAKRTLIVHSLYAAHPSRALDTLRNRHIPVVASLEVACRCVAAAAERGRFLQRAPRTAEPTVSTVTPVAPEIGAARAEGRHSLLESEARTLLERCGVPLVSARFCRTESEAVEALPSEGAAALKIVAPSIVHKTDVGGVVLGVSAPTEASAAFRRLMGIAADTRGVLVSPMLREPVAEVLVGAARDAQFGPVLTAGAGGRLVELHRDVAIRLLPLTRADVSEMLAETVVGTMLRGVRGRPPGDREALIDLILRFWACFLMHDAITDFELNPIFVFETGALAVDARALLGNER